MQERFERKKTGDVGMGVEVGGRGLAVGVRDAKVKGRRNPPAHLLRYIRANKLVNKNKRAVHSYHPAQITKCNPIYLQAILEPLTICHVSGNLSDVTRQQVILTDQT